ncbi:MAG: helix-turn-helix domain-containing protein [Lachnospiraceae bacterium]|nr:helix-turn-helix domain-containing protein [Lachnospiraceae bacterium]
MLTDQVIANCLEDVKKIAGIELTVTDASGSVVASTSGMSYPKKEDITLLTQGDQNELEISDKIYIRINDDEESAYVLVATGKEDGFVSARLAALQIRNLITAYQNKVDRNSFFQNLLLDNYLDVDMYNRAGKLHVDAEKRRCVFVIEPVGRKDSNLIEPVRELFYSEAGDVVTAVDKDHVVVIKALDKGDGETELKETAEMLVDMAGSEASSDVRVSYGTVAEDIKGVSRSYKEAKIALEVSRIFYPMRRTIEYSNLGVGRLIYQLPVNLCQLFIKEIFGDDIPEEIDEETLTTVNKFFENSLNVSETSRQLFIHRNTLIYRIEKLQKATGLDVRVFDDALTLKIALMVVNYIRFRGSLSD